MNPVQRQTLTVKVPHNVLMFCSAVVASTAAKVLLFQSATQSDSHTRSCCAASRWRFWILASIPVCVSSTFASALPSAHSNLKTQSSLRLCQAGSASDQIQPVAAHTLPGGDGRPRDPTTQGPAGGYSRALLRCAYGCHSSARCDPVLTVGG